MPHYRKVSCQNFYNIMENTEGRLQIRLKLLFSIEAIQFAQYCSKTHITFTDAVLKCELCGSISPKSKCAECNNQILCASCDDMYHRHPKRKLHVRKVQKKKYTKRRSTDAYLFITHFSRQMIELPQSDVKPPLPPKGELSIPVPPPRKNKKGFMVASPHPGRKEQVRNCVISQDLRRFSFINECT